MSPYTMPSAASVRPARPPWRDVPGALVSIGPPDSGEVATLIATNGLGGAAAIVTSAGTARRRLGARFGLFVDFGVGVGRLELVARSDHRQSRDHAVHVEAVRRAHARLAARLG